MSGMRASHVSREFFLCVSRILGGMIGILVLASVASAQLVINEFSNGPNGSKEFYELAVVGSPGSFQDLRGWMVDDHSGFFGCGSGNGIASGHVRFAQHTNWACVPTGSLILLYNPGDINPAITLANDPTDANNDGVYVLPVTSSPYLEANNSIPNSGSCNNYAGPYAAPTSWTPLALGNSGDAVQTIDPGNTTAPHHAVGYGSIGMPLPGIYFTGSGSGDNFSFTNATSNVWSLQANWTLGPASTTDSPGQSNGLSNQTWLSGFELQASANPTSGCVPLTVNFTSNSNATGHTYSWDFGDNTAGSGTSVSHTYTTVNTFQAVLTVTGPNGCTLTDTVTISTAGGGSVTLPTVNSVCVGAAPVSLAGATPAGGTWSGPGVTGSTFDPAAAGTGTHTLVYSVTTSCLLTDSLTVQVFPLPTASFVAPGPFCAHDPMVALPVGTPAGGTYSGTGVSGSNWDPNIAGVGTHSLVYTYTDGNGCTDRDTQSVVVNAVPAPSLSPFPAVCVSGAPITLSSGAPAGGTYSGPGVSGTSFDPSVAGTGTHTITYSVTSNGCTGSASQPITVATSPAITFPPLNPVCVNATSVSLTGATPAGGTYSGPGVTGTTFSPAGAGVGTHTITYSWSAGTCSGTATQNIAVNALPNVTLAPFANACFSTAPFTLVGGTPAGGTYAGPGVSSNQFDPQVAGIGTHMITYTFVDGNNCSSTATQSMTVLAVPTVAFGLVPDQCISGIPLTLTTGIPAGGVYSGPGVSGNQFDPASAGLGTHTLNYTVSSGGCTNTATRNVTVIASPTVIFPPLPDQCVNGASLPLTSATPAGGTYSGFGVSANAFSPATAGVGTHTVVYTWSSGSCSAVDSQFITVHPIPSVSLAPFNDVCESSAAFLLSGGSPSGGTYSGSGVVGNQFNPALAGVGTHTISYSVTNANNCTGVASQTIQVVPLPAITWNVPADVCIGSGVVDIGSAVPAGGTYSGPGVQGVSFDPTQAGVGAHTLWYQVTVNGCTDSLSRTLTVLPQPSVNITSTGSTSPCLGDTILLTAAGVGNLEWNTGETTSSIQPLQSGVFVVSATNSCGVATDSVEVNFVDGLELLLNGNDYLCPNITSELSVQTNGQIRWSTGAEEEVIRIDRAGTYWVEVFSTCDTLRDTITVRQVPGIALSGEMHPDRNNEYRFGVRPADAFPFSWYINDQIVPRENGSLLTYSFQESGGFVVGVQATSIEGCLLSDTMQVSIDRLFSLYLPNTFTPNGDGDNDVFRVVGERPRQFEALIFNRWGQLLYAWYDIDGGWDGTANGQPCGDGVYVVHVVADGRRIIQSVTLLNR